MKEKRAAILFALVLLAMIALPLAVSDVRITGYQTSRPTNVSVFVLPAQPTLQIISPTATTYDEGEPILLDYTAILIDTVWYNLDNSSNTTINQSFYFYASPGTHTLYLYGNLSNGTVLSDNVTFTVEEEAPGGKGTVTITPEEKIEIVLEKEIIEIALRQGEEKQIKLFVKNNEEKTVTVTLEDLDIDDFITSISRTEFPLNPGQTEEVLITFKAEENTIPNVYLEKILIKSDGSEKELSFYVEVESKEFLFDVDVNIPEEPALFYPGETLIANVMFYNLGVEGETEVSVEYLIKDPETDNIVFGEKQTLIIGTSTSLTKAFPIPSNIESGDYVFYVRAVYDSKTASASKWFRVLPVSILPKNIQKMLDGIREDGPYLAMAIFTFMMMFIGFTAFQILAAKYGWFGARRAYCKAGKKPAAGKKYAASRKPKHKTQNYKKRIRKNLKRIKK